jgi:hypothetical protein
MLRVGGCGILLREFIGRESIDDRGFIGRELFEAAPIPRLPKSPPALEGRGTDRAPIAPFCGPLELLNAGPRLPLTELLNPTPRLPAPMVGRCCDAPKVERCIPPVCPGLDTSAALACRPFALNEPRLPARAPELKEPRFAALFPARIPALSDPRFPAATAVRLTTGRAKACCGGTVALVPRDPSMLARVGATPGE